MSDGQKVLSKYARKVRLELNVIEFRQIISLLPSTTGSAGSILRTGKKLNIFVKYFYWAGLAWSHLSLTVGGERTDRRIVWLAWDLPTGDDMTHE